MNVLTITLLFIKLLISLQLSSAQHKQPFHQITGHHNYGLNGREEVANVEALPEEKGIRVPIISDIQNILKPTKASHETQKQEQRPVPPKQPYRPMRPPSVTGPKPIVSVDDFDDNSFAAKPSHIFRPNPSDEDLDSHWDKGKKKPSNVWPNPVSDDKPADIPDPYESESDFPYNDGVPLNQPTNHGREPNTIQEWMNENRPVSQQKPPRVPPIEAKAPNKPIEPHPAPWDYPNPDLQKPVVLPQKPDSRPQPIKPSFQPAPWEKPKPVDDEEDNQWWDSNPTTPKPKPPYDSPYNEWDTDDDTVNPDQHKFKPKPQKPLPAPEWWDEKPSRPEPEPEYEPPPPSFPHKPSKPEIPSTGWTGNPNLPVWWNDKPSRPESEPEPEDDNNGWGGNVFGENTGNGIGGVGDTNGIGGAMVGNGSGNGEGGVGSQNGIGGNIIQSNGANGVGGVGNDNGQGGFIVGHDSGNGKGGVGNNNGIGGNKGGKNSANGTGGVGNNNGKGGLIIGSHSGNGVGGVNQNIPPGKPPVHKP